MTSPTSSASVPPKRRAPISASAFNYSLDPSSTPQSKRPRPLSTFGGLPAFSPAPNRSSQTPALETKVNLNETPSKKVFTTLDSLPSPFLLRTSTPQAGPSRATHRLNDLLDDVSPIKGRWKGHGETGDNVPTVRLGELPGQRMTEDVGRRVKKVVEEDEGIGVSPRKARTGVRWTGKGPPPPSLQLASLLASVNSSLVLFYTSLHQTLHPSRKSTSAPPSIIKHIRTAPIHLVLKSAVSGPTHHALMFWCEVLRWRSKPSDTNRCGESDVDMEIDEEAKEVLVAFQPLPNGCARLGIDPRVVTARLGEGRIWEVGVWGPYSEVEVPLSPAGLKGTEGEEEAEDEKEEGYGTVEEGGKVRMEQREETYKEEKEEPRRTKVLMATRYLVAQAEA